MSLAQHLVRRGAVYYWRRRLPRRLAARCNRGHVFLSLRTWSPDRARSLAAQLDAVLAEIAMLAETNFLSASQLDAMLRDVVAAHSAKLDRVAAAAKLDRGFDAVEAARMDRRIGWVYRLLDVQGSDALVRSEDYEAMIADGLSEADIAFVDQHLAFLEANGTVPTPRSRLATLVERHGGAATSMNLASAQQVYFRGLSLALFETERRHAGKVAEAGEIISAALHVDRAPQTTLPPAPLTVPAANNRLDEPTDKPGSTADAGIREVGDKLIRDRAKDKIWDTKTQKQARQIYTLLARFAAEECHFTSITAIKQGNLGTFVDFLRHDIYKFYGKSTKDETRSIKQLRAEAAKYDASLRGITGVTLNRHLTNLGELFGFARASGVAVDAGIDTSALRARKSKTRARDQRPKMDLRVSKRVFHAPPFAGCTAWHQPYEKGEQIYHRALYYVPMLLEYEGTRREEACGLATDDIFLDSPIPYIHVRPNEFRRIKNPQSDRLVPLHPELLRLGFSNYVKLIRSLGYRRVFPDLHSPSTLSPLGDRFYDEFMPLLSWAAETENVELKLVLHSLRHGFNSRLKAELVHAEERADLMGHRGNSETTERYADPVRLQRALDVVTKLPVLTAHLAPRPIQLLPWVQAREVAPFSRLSKSTKR